MKQNYVTVTLCMPNNRVCESASLSLELRVRSSPNFFTHYTCYLWPWLGPAIHCAFPILRMTLYLHIMGPKQGVPVQHWNSQPAWCSQAEWPRFWTWPDRRPWLLKQQARPHHPRIFGRKPVIVHDVRLYGFPRTNDESWRMVCSRL